MSRPDPAPELIGRALGAYRILDSLGSGGMGAVYLAEDTRLGRKVALKVLPAETGKDPERIQRFEREARAIASLNHPGIVTLHSIEEEDGVRFLTMEHVEGTTLARAIPQRGLSPERLLPLAIALADAVAAAHRHGVLHRDLKPENVMLTAEGRLKVLDFGLAKLRDDAEEKADRTKGETQTVTQDGRIVGTVAYMSPEQAQGLTMDHRSDIFSLGILLYEMATGERPFKGSTNLSVLSAILKDMPRPPGELREDLARPLARMIQRALEKRPEDRYQAAADLCRDLEDLKRDVDSGELLQRTTAGRPAVALPSRRRWVLGGVAAGLVLLVLAGMLARGARSKRVAGGEGQPSVAVFYFDNLTDDPKLSWLRTGLTEMLVTNLSQSPGLRVLGTTRLSQILDDLGYRDEPTTSARVVEAVAQRTQATTALVGSFVKAGALLRIQATLQDPRSGEVLASERVEGDAEEGLFALVDELTGRLRGRLETPATAQESEHSLERVTTSSITAFKAYSEGSRLHDRLDERAALAEFEKAVAADPGFAMALAKLSVVHGNLGNQEKAREYAARSLENAAKLPPGERHYIEGRQHSLEEATLEKAVAAYQAAVDSDPDHTAARNNLAQLLLALRRYPEALVHLQELRRRGMTFPGSWMSLAEAYVATGRPEEAEAVLREYVRQHPDRGAGHANLGFFLLSRGRTREALADFDRAAQLGPAAAGIEMGRFVAHAALGEWAEAEASARGLAASADPGDRSHGYDALVALSLTRGDLGEARRLSTAALSRAQGEVRMRIRVHRARLELDLDDTGQALAEVERALGEEAGDPRSRAVAHAIRALGLTRLGRMAEARKSEDEVERVFATLPAAMVETHRLRVQGYLALARGDYARALVLLERARAAAGPPLIKLEPDELDTDYAYALAAAGAGEAERERAALARIVASGPQRIFSPLPFVRSLARLARLEERAGRTAEARKLYERYLGHWRDGQIDRPEVARVGRRLAALAAKAG